jgi:hypothetical protein
MTMDKDVIQELNEMWDNIDLTKLTKRQCTKLYLTLQDIEESQDIVMGS